MARKQSFEGNCEILRTIFQGRALSSDIQACWKGAQEVFHQNKIRWQTSSDKHCPILYQRDQFYPIGALKNYSVGQIKYIYPPINLIGELNPAMLYSLWERNTSQDWIQNTHLFQIGTSHHQKIHPKTTKSWQL